VEKVVLGPICPYMPDFKLYLIKKQELKQKNAQERFFI
jgi:hypothetical protein